MSSLFELNERVRRLRETFLYFKNAALLTGEEIRVSAYARDDAQAQAEWASLLGELRQCLNEAEAVMARNCGPAATALPSFAAQRLDTTSTRH